MLSGPRKTQNHISGGNVRVSECSSCSVLLLFHQDNDKKKPSLNKNLLLRLRRFIKRQNYSVHNIIEDTGKNVHVIQLVVQHI